MEPHLALTHKIMTEEFKQTIEEELKKLPKHRVEAMASVDWEKISEDIGSKYSFPPQDLNNLQAEIFLVLIGAENSDLFSLNVAYNVVKTKEVAEKIANEVMDRIFVPIAKEVEKSIKIEAGKVVPTWHQNVEFVLSGGDYSVFLKKPESNSGDGPPIGQKV